MSLHQPTVVLHYWHRARSFQRTAVDLDVLDDTTKKYAPSIGLLSVHACIALTDAMLAALGEQRTKRDDHSESARRLRKCCSAKGIHQSGIDHFEWLLSRKTHFSYGEEFVEDQHFTLAKIKMDQFFKWAYGAFPDVSRLKETDYA